QGAGTKPGPVAPPAAEVVAVQGMPAQASLGILLDLDALRAALPVTAADLNRLPVGLFGQAADQTTDPSGKADPARRWWLDGLATASACGSLALGGWCLVRLRRRRQAPGQMRICWGNENSSDYSE